MARRFPAHAACASTEFHLNGLVFHYDANAGQKTGAFLDQRTNYAAAQQWAQRLGATGRASTSAATRAVSLCILPRSAARSRASTLARLAGSGGAQPSGQPRPNAPPKSTGSRPTPSRFSATGRRPAKHFDAIVLDPPAFAKSKRAVEGALRGYKELNLRALKMLRPGGLLVTCSCSHHVGWADLESAVAAAAADASRRVRLLERRGAAPDHPVILNLPETEYLKCLVLEVE